MPSKIFQNSQDFVCSFALVSHWSKNSRGPASLFFKPEIWSAIRADNGKTTIVLDPALPPQNTETFQFPKCLTRQLLVDLSNFSHIQSEELLKHVDLLHYSLQTSKCLGLALNLENRVFKSKTQHGIELNVCTVHMKNKSDLEHAQLTRGPDSGPRNRILPDLVSSSPIPSPLPLFFVLEPPKRDLGTRSE